MANFNNDVNLEPNFGVSISFNPVKKTQRYADGYEHRLVFGLPANQNPRTITLPFTDISTGEADTLIGFLKARDADNASFDYTPPNEPAGKFVVEGEYSKRLNYAGLASVTVTFREVFEP